MPRPLVTVNANGSAIDRSTWVSAAKLTIASTPSAARRRPRDPRSRPPQSGSETQSLQVLAPAGVGQLVEHCHLVAVLAHPQLGEGGADEPGGAAHQQLHDVRPPRAAPDTPAAPDASLAAPAPRARCAGRCTPGAAPDGETLGADRDHLATGAPAAATISRANSNHEHWPRRPRAGSRAAPAGRAPPAPPALPPRWPVKVGQPTWSSTTVSRSRSPASVRMVWESSARRSEQPRRAHDRVALGGAARHRALAHQLGAPVARARPDRV